MREQSKEERINKLDAFGDEIRQIHREGLCSSELLSFVSSCIGLTRHNINKE